MIQRLRTSFFSNDSESMSTSESSRDYSTVLRLPTTAEVNLSPLDVFSHGLAISLNLYYMEILDVGKLRTSLNKTLEHFPVLTGRYKPDATHPSSKVCLNNGGVPLEVAYTTDNINTVIGRLVPGASTSDNNKQTTSQIFSKDFISNYFPSASQDIHTGSQDDPLLAVKITVMAPGTLISVTMQHGIADAEALLVFMIAWSRVFRGLTLEEDAAPHHSRKLPVAVTQRDNPFPHTFRVLKGADKVLPEYKNVLPKIIGNKMCILQVNTSTLVEMKKSASQGLPQHRWVSTNDIITARIWRAFVKMRCTQMDLAPTSVETTTLHRALNLRTRLSPPLNPNWFGNAFSFLSISLTVKQITTMSVAQVTLKLRTNMQKQNTADFAALLKWMNDEQKRGGKICHSFDSKALTFVIDSWNFPKHSWESIDFGGIPGFSCSSTNAYSAHVMARSGRDGVNVIISGLPDALKSFVEAFYSDTI